MRGEVAAHVTWLRLTLALALASALTLALAHAASKAALLGEMCDSFNAMRRKLLHAVSNDEVAVDRHRERRLK